MLGRGTAVGKGAARRLAVKVRLTPAGRRLLRRARAAVPLRLSATVTPAGGKAVAVAATKTVRR